MKYRVQNLAGRDLGTYEGADEYEAFGAMCFEGGYGSPQDAEKARFAYFERIKCTPVDEAG